MGFVRKLAKAFTSVISRGLRWLLRAIPVEAAELIVVSLATNITDQMRTAK